MARQVATRVPQAAIIVALGFGYVMMFILSTVAEQQILREYRRQGVSVD